MERVETRLSLDMHHVGQTHSIAVPLPADAAERLSEELVAARFDGAYARAFARKLDGIPRRIVSYQPALPCD